MILFWIICVPVIALRLPGLDSISFENLAKQQDSVNQKEQDSSDWVASIPRNYEPLILPDFGTTLQFTLGTLEAKEEIKALNLTFGKSCPNEAAPKVAVCFAGMSRSFASPEQAAYINTMLLKPIRDAGGHGLVGTPPDVFVNTRLGKVTGHSKTPKSRDWTDKDYKNGTDYANQTMIQRLADSMHANANKREFVEESIKEIGAVDFVIDNYADEEIRNPINKQNKKRCFAHMAPWTVDHGLSYFKDMFGCLTMIRKAENTTNQKYDAVVVSRTDTWEIDKKKERTLRAIQCKHSLFVRDSMSYQTRASFEIFGNYLNDQFLNPKCHAPQHRNQEAFTRDIARIVKGSYVGG